MSETEKTLEATVKEVTEASAADAPKKNAVTAEPTHLKNDAEDLGPAVVKSTDSNPDATKKIKQVSGDPQQKSQGAAESTPKLSGHNTKLESKETEKDSEDKEIKEGELPAGLKKYLDKKDDKESGEKKEGAHSKKEGAHSKKEEKEFDVAEHVDALSCWR
jgi:hypothetical protein